MTIVKTIDASYISVDLVGSEELIQDESFAVASDVLGRFAQELLPKVEMCEVSVSLVSDEKIHEMNRKFRGIDKATDVLSFPVHENLREEEVEGPLNLGDIIISVDTAKDQAQKHSITLMQEILHLYVHGLLHLLGFDHEISEEEEKRMFKIEEDLVGKIYERIN